MQGSNMSKISPLFFSEEHEFALRRLRALIEGLPITFATHVAGGFLFLVLFLGPDLRAPLLIW